ncbi:hypothetical protein [Winogradskyella sp. 3972H.M.0a.05]|uniref:hypothetical protein n=1 Tax=Winogradskyella sp. 3972H.M.0a.05 TaxID=2950277 RepID=UPI0033974AFF
MKKTFTLLILLLLVSSCKTSNNNNNRQSKTIGKVVKKGIIECFENGLLDKDGKPVFCEASGVIYHNGMLIIASDKDIPGKNRSSVFEFKKPKQFPSVIDTKSISYIDKAPFRNVEKIEAFTKSLDSDLILVSTAFDRIKSGSNDFDGFNSLLYWNRNKDWVKYVLKSDNKGIKSSKGLRPYFKKTLKSTSYPNGPSYYKIEGMTTAPNNTIIFGAREIGNSYKTPEFKLLLISTNYAYMEKKFLLDENFSHAYEYNIDDAKLPKKNIGISSIEYNHTNEAFYIITSFEYENNSNIELGAYIWKLPYKSFLSNKPPSLVTGKDGTPLLLDNKAEGFTFIDDNTIFIICDDDRESKTISTGNTNIKRLPHQAPFYIVEIN